MNLSVKKTIAFFSLAFLISCSDKETKKEIASVNSSFPLHTGNWKVKKYVFSETSALSEKEAEAWIGRTGTFGRTFVFPFSQLSIYRDVFKSDTLSTDFEVLKDTLMSADELFQQYYCSKEKLGVSGPEILVLKTNLPETPFEEIFKLNENEIMVIWDGVFFYLEKN